MVGDAIRRLADKGDEVYSVVGEVLEVDGLERTCSVRPLAEEEEDVIYGVRLQAEIGGDKGMVLFPKKGSTVVVTFMNNMTGYVALCSEYEKLEWAVGTKVLTFDKDGLRVESEASDLKSELNSLADLLNSILTTLQTFQLATNVGPTISVMPNIVADLAQYQLDLAQFKQNLNTIVQ